LGITIPWPGIGEKSKHAEMGIQGQPALKAGANWGEKSIHGKQEVVVAVNAMNIGYKQGNWSKPKENGNHTVIVREEIFTNMERKETRMNPVV
jgi:hypothetical protein